jgi:hypothetical protein
MALSDRFDDIQNMLSWFELHKNDFTTIAESDKVTDAVLRLWYPLISV